MNKHINTQDINLILDTYSSVTTSNQSKLNHEIETLYITYTLICEKMKYFNMYNPDPNVIMNFKSFFFKEEMIQNHQCNGNCHFRHLQSNQIYTNPLDGVSFLSKSEVYVCTESLNTHICKTNTECDQSYIYNGYVCCNFTGEEKYVLFIPVTKESRENMNKETYDDVVYNMCSYTETPLYDIKVKSKKKIIKDVPKYINEKIKKREEENEGLKKGAFELINSPIDTKELIKTDKPINHGNFWVSYGFKRNNVQKIRKKRNSLKFNPLNMGDPTKRKKILETDKNNNIGSCASYFNTIVSPNIKNIIYSKIFERNINKLDNTLPTLSNKYNNKLTIIEYLEHFIKFSENEIKGFNLKVSNEYNSNNLIKLLEKSWNLVLNSYYSLYDTSKNFEQPNFIIHTTAFVRILAGRELTIDIALNQRLKNRLKNMNLKKEISENNIIIANDIDELKTLLKSDHYFLTIIKTDENFKNILIEEKFMKNIEKYILKIKYNSDTEITKAINIFKKCLISYVLQYSNNLIKNFKQNKDYLSVIKYVDDYLTSCKSLIIQN